MANEKAYQHAELLPADITASHILRVSKLAGAGNNFINLFKLLNFPFSIFAGNITQANSVGAGNPTVVETYNGIESSPGVPMSWTCVKITDGQYKFTPDIVFDVDKIVYGVLPNYLSSNGITNADMFNMKFDTGDKTFAIQSGDLGAGFADNKYDKTTFFILKFP